MLLGMVKRRTTQVRLEVSNRVVGLRHREARGWERKRERHRDTG
jgi:hypothetical protein